MNETEKLLQQTEKNAERYAALERMITAPEIIADNRYWRKLVAERESLSDVVSLRERLVALSKERNACLTQLADEKNDEMKKLLAEELAALSDKEQDACRKLSRLLLAKNGEEKAVLELVPNGNKASDYCKTLCACLAAYADTHEIAVQEKRLKNATLLYFAGAGAYALAQEETGVHKFILGETAYTVTATALSPRENGAVDLTEKDLRIDLFHSGGAGGQNINKVETAIRITHLPTGIVVTCQDERSQLMNKRRAMETLKKKLVHLQEKQQCEAEDALRKKAATTVVCTYYMNTNTVTRSDGKYDLSEYLQGRRKQ
ncbi:MAG: PCRF domain-containing protein [Clostridia bacterium]|nr:PCRF domain-containing protein [Clostridia bacterium]